MNTFSMSSITNIEQLVTLRVDSDSQEFVFYSAEYCWTHVVGQTDR